MEDLEETVILQKAEEILRTKYGESEFSGAIDRILKKKRLEGISASIERIEKILHNLTVEAETLRLEIKQSEYAN